MRRASFEDFLRSELNFNISEGIFFRKSDSHKPLIELKLEEFYNFKYDFIKIPYTGKFQIVTKNTTILDTLIEPELIKIVFPNHTFYVGCGMVLDSDYNIIMSIGFRTLFYSYSSIKPSVKYPEALISQEVFKLKNSLILKNLIRPFIEKVNNWDITFNRATNENYSSSLIIKFGESGLRAMIPRNFGLNFNPTDFVKTNKNKLLDII
jgi:hypothetical protein